MEAFLIFSGFLLLLEIIGLITFIYAIKTAQFIEDEI